MKKTKMLKKNYEFRNVLKNGKCYYAKYIQAYILKNDYNGILLGLAVGTKIGKAYQRNKIKRLIRESYKLIENNIEDGYSVVFLVNKRNFNYKELNFSDIKKDMVSILKNSKLMVWK